MRRHHRRRAAVAVDENATAQTQARAMVVREYLAKKFRVNNTRVRTKGFGEDARTDSKRASCVEIIVYPGARSVVSAEPRLRRPLRRHLSNGRYVAPVVPRTRCMATFVAYACRERRQRPRSSTRRSGSAKRGARPLAASRCAMMSSVTRGYVARYWAAIRAHWRPAGEQRRCRDCEGSELLRCASVMAAPAPSAAHKNADENAVTGRHERVILLRLAQPLHRLIERQAISRRPARRPGTRGSPG